MQSTWIRINMDDQIIRVEYDDYYSYWLEIVVVAVENYQKNRDWILNKEMSIQNNAIREPG
jgi:hypothetical protein